MHTDEYEISLTRELKVCKKTVEKIKKKLAGLERRHGMKTEVFMENYMRCGADLQNDDSPEWMRQHEELRKWETLEMQYAELLRKMKV